MDGSNIDYEQTTSSFRERRYLYVKNLLPSSVLEYLKVYYQILRANDKFRKDNQCSVFVGAWRRSSNTTLYLGGSPGRQPPSGILDLVPTYSYTHPHICGRMTVYRATAIALRVKSPLPFRSKFRKVPGPSVIPLKPPNRPDTTIEMLEGDACVYAGTEVEHWREAFYEDGYIQLFLHWIDKRGKYYPKLTYDRRKNLGAPRIVSSPTFAKPPPHGNLSNWLGTDMLARLLNYAETSRDSFKSSNVGHGDNKKIDRPTGDRPV